LIGSKAGLSFNFDYTSPRNLAYSTENLTDFTNPHVLQYLKKRSALKTTRGAFVTYIYRKSFLKPSFQVGFEVARLSDTIANLNRNFYGKEEEFTISTISLTLLTLNIVM